MFAALARLVVRYPVQVVLVWLLLVLLAVPAARLAPQNLAANASDVKNSEAQRVLQILNESFGLPSVDRTVLVSESSLPAHDPRFRQVYNQLIARIQSLEGVLRIHRYDAPSPLQQQSQDGKITATLLDTRLENGEAVIEALRREARAAQT
ncbi:MAG: MMPL family transporter, partial [Meiothermus sp.]|nr:MMPL family transporter [Meiothermus sp.]